MAAASPDVEDEASSKTLCVQTSYYEELEKASKKVPQEELMRLKWINIVIDRIESVKKLDSFDNLHPKVKETLNKYFVAEVENPAKPNNIEKKLRVKKEGSTSESWEAVPLTKTFPIVMKAHQLTNHGGIAAMAACLSSAHFVVASICLPALLKVCKDCPKRVIEKKRDQDNKVSGLIDIVNMSIYSTDEKLDRLLIYQDLNSKFLQLRPVSSVDLVESTSNELTILFGDMGPPEWLMVPAILKDLFIQVLERLNHLFGVKIKVITRDKATEEVVTNSVSLKVETAIKNWLSSAVEKKWCIGSYIVQWELNNIHEEEQTPFQIVFGSNDVNKNSEDAQIIESVKGLNINPSNEMKIDDFISENPVLEMPLEF